VERPEGPEQLTKGPPFHISEQVVFSAFAQQLGAYVVPLLHLHDNKFEADQAPPTYWDMVYAVIVPHRHDAATLNRLNAQ
jgi:hypothetical protein